MPNDGIATPRVPVVKIKPDHDQVIEEESMDEDDPDGGESLDIDKALHETGQTPNLKDSEMDTEAVDEPLKHAEENDGDENL